jgi:hypothetical protein
VTTESELFHPVETLPEGVRQDRYNRLVGLDDVKARLRKKKPRSSPTQPY